MPRTIRTFFDPNFQDSHNFIELDASESFHLVKVLRLEIGNKVEALDGNGMVYKTIIYDLNNKKLKLSILDKIVFDKPIPQFEMFISLIKGNRWEDMIRPLTELGVSRLTPLQTEHSESNLKHKNISEKMVKWKKIAQDACKQSGNPWLPFIDKPLEFKDLLLKVNNQEALFASLSIFSKRIQDIKFTNAKKIKILIGPEGGWSKKEEDVAREKGLTFFRFSKNTLRVETAAITSLAVARENFMI